MKLTFHLNATLYDCILRIRCENGFNVAYRMTATAPLGSNLIDTVTVEVPAPACEVIVYPQFCEQWREEVKSFRSEQTAPSGVATFNPAFDVTPSELIAGIITEYGVVTAPYIENIKKLQEKSKEDF